MATINLGRVKPVFRGAYDAATAYVIDDIVTYQDETYIAITATTGNLPTVTANWTKLAAKGVDGTDVSTTLTTQGDLLYRDGSGLQRLGAGTSGQALITGGTGANPSWGDVSGGLLQVVYSSTDVNATTTSTNFVDTGLQGIITPSSTSSKILVQVNFTISAESTSGSYSVGASLERNGTTIGGGSASGRYANGGFLDYWTAGGYPYQTEKAGYQFLDSPNSTSALTYKLRYASGYTGNDGGTAFFNRNDADDDHFDNVSSMTLMEIGV